MSIEYFDSNGGIIGPDNTIQTTTQNEIIKGTGRASKTIKSYLTEGTDYAKPFELPVTLGDMTTQAGTNIAGYQGTDIAGTEGGTLFASVYGNDALNNIKIDAGSGNLKSGNIKVYGVL